MTVDRIQLKVVVSSPPRDWLFCRSRKLEAGCIDPVHDAVEPYRVNAIACSSAVRTGQRRRSTLCRGRRLVGCFQASFPPEEELGIDPIFILDVFVLGAQPSTQAFTFFMSPMLFSLFVGACSGSRTRMPLGGGV